MNLGMLLEMAVEGAGERVLLGPRDGGLTAMQLHEHARRAAARFSSEKFEHVALVDVNSEIVPIALFGAALAGLPFAPLNYRLGDDQLREIIARLAPVAIVAGPDTAGRRARPCSLRSRPGCVIRSRPGCRRGVRPRARRAFSGDRSGRCRCRGGHPVHQRYDGGGEGGRAAASPPGLVRHRHRGVPGSGRRRSSARQRAAVPHRGRLDDLDVGLQRPAPRLSADVRCGALGGHRRDRVDLARDGRADDARSNPRRDRGARRSTAEPSPLVVRRRTHAGRRDRTGDARASAASTS